MLVIKVKKQRQNQVDKLRNQLSNKGDGLSVEVGHFQEQGLHYSGYSYPELMRIHHYGYDPTTGHTFAAARPVMSILKRNSNAFKKHAVVKKAMQEWINRKPGKTNNEKLLNTLGRLIIGMEQKVIGNPVYLEVTNNPTPLKDTGDLRKKVALRTSTSKKVTVKRGIKP